MRHFWVGWEYLSPMFRYLFAPQSATELAIYYLLWISIFLFINITWDIFTPKTETFHISRMKDKISTVHSASFFCSSLLLLLSVVEPPLFALAKDTYVPIILAGASGLLSSSPALCPYEIEAS